MALGEVRRTMADGSVKTYTYHRVSDLERARAWLEKYPLTAAPSGRGHSVVWRGKTAKHTVTFQDRTIVALIREGYAVCLGQHVERKGIVR